MRVLVTAGPTREPLDPVRYLTNRSSGKMGYAMADAFARSGHSVLLVSGPTALEVPDGVDFLPVETAAEMFDAVQRHIGRMDAAVFAAAVADYRPAEVSDQKIKKTGDTLTLDLVRTADILGSVRGDFGFAGTLVGFAAETRDLEANAKEKLKRKGCDLVVANDVSKPGIGFDSDRNEVLLVFPEHVEALPEDEKHHLAPRIVREIERIAAEKNAK
jgi:phosphopantothenoylcysteine decarboxylase/phosphopantothenate--cysteine ligase